MKGNKKKNNKMKPSGLGCIWERERDNKINIMLGCLISKRNFNIDMEIRIINIFFCLFNYFIFMRMMTLMMDNSATNIAGNDNHRRKFNW